MKKKIMICILIIIVLLISFSYYKYVYIPKREIYDIKYLNLKKVKIIGSATPTKVELNNNGLYFKASFLNVGDAITYTFDVVNDGTIKGRLGHLPIYFGTDAITKKYFFNTLTYEDGTDIKTNDIIEPGDTKKMTLTVNFMSNPNFVTQDSGTYETTIMFLYLQDR